MKEYPTISGQLFYSNSLDGLNSLFQDSQLMHEIRHSSHYTDGRYFKVALNTETSLTFDKIDAHEILIEGDSDSESDLNTLCQTVSAILSTHKLKHRFELYTTDDVEFSYYNYDWSK